MRPVIQEVSTSLTPEALVSAVEPKRGVVLLRSDYFDSPHARYSFVCAEPFLTFESFGSRCATIDRTGRHEFYGDPWHALDSLMARYELLDEMDLPFPIGGCFGYWGYDLKNFVEPRLPRTAVNDLELPDCWAGFYSSLVVFDHRLGKAWIVSSGVNSDGTRTPDSAGTGIEFWSALFERSRALTPHPNPLPSEGRGNRAARLFGCDDFSPSPLGGERAGVRGAPQRPGPDPSQFREVSSNLRREEFIRMVRRAQEYIRRGHIYQANLSHRLTAAWAGTGWEFFLRLKEASPAPYAAYLHCGDFELASSSPEMFLRISGSHIRTRPIKGTRPRHGDPTRDAQLSYELQTSAKEISELVMITDLLRNDLGRYCEFGSVQVPDLVRLERYPQVQHLVSTVEGRLRDGVTHFAAFASSFPGGSITGAPKIRAMEIIDELEPVSRGPYTGALGYLGFNRESQLSIVIRTALRKDGLIHFNVGAGIVADSIPEAEYEETVAKARGFLNALAMDREKPDLTTRNNCTTF
jgi:para-aminobenzoate synthetase component 1